MDMQVAALDILTTKGGFAPAAARAIGEAMYLQIARSYQDLATNQRLDSAIDRLRTELKVDIAALEVKMEKLKSDIVRWMFAALVGQTAVMGGLMRLFMPHGP